MQALSHVVGDTDTMINRFDGANAGAECEPRHFVAPIANPRNYSQNTKAAADSESDSTCNFRLKDRPSPCFPPCASSRLSD